MKGGWCLSPICSKPNPTLGASSHKRGRGPAKAGRTLYRGPGEGSRLFLPADLSKSHEGDWTESPQKRPQTAGQPAPEPRSLLWQPHLLLHSSSASSSLLHPDRLLAASGGSRLERTGKEAPGSLHTAPGVAPSDERRDYRQVQTSDNKTFSNYDILYMYQCSVLGMRAGETGRGRLSSPSIFSASRMFPTSRGSYGDRQNRIVT